MRSLFATLAVVTVSLAGVASAQQQNPMSYVAMTRAKAGMWAEYTMTMPGQAEQIKVRYAVTEKTDREMTLDTDSNTPLGLVHTSMTFAPSHDAWKLVHALVKMGTNPEQDLPASKLSDGSVKKSDTPGKLVGPEKITVPAGTFETKHYKHELPKEAGGMTLDVWMSDKAEPTGVVKLSGAGGIEMVLSATGTGAKAKPEADKHEAAKPEAKPAPGVEPAKPEAKPAPSVEPAKRAKRAKPAQD
jgi:hypothetical protein